MLRPTLFRIVAAGLASLIIGCGSADPGSSSIGDQPAPAVASPANPPVAAPPTSGGQFIRMKVDGVEWAADREIFCANAPAGMDPMLIVSGSFGPKDADEQAFNLNLSNVEGPGTLHLVGGGSLTHAIQLANLDQSRYLNGGVMGFDVNVEIIEFTRDPTSVELRFDGTLNSSAGAPLRIEGGHVRCSE
jgi:hypothetical protein